MQRSMHGKDKHQWYIPNYILDGSLIICDRNLEKKYWLWALENVEWITKPDRTTKGNKRHRISMIVTMVWLTIPLMVVGLYTYINPFISPAVTGFGVPFEVMETWSMHTIYYPYQKTQHRSIHFFMSIGWSEVHV